MSEMTRRKFLKRTGGATVAGIVAANLSVLAVNARAEEEGQGSSYRMKLDDIAPESGLDWDVKDVGATIDGSYESIRVAIEILSGPSFVGFPESATAIDLYYSVVASVGIQRFGSFVQVASVGIDYEARCWLESVESPDLSSRVEESITGEVLPSSFEVNFVFNENGDVYTLSIENLDFTVANPIEGDGDPGNQTFVAAAAKVTGNGLNAETQEKSVTHTFASFQVE